MEPLENKIIDEEKNKENSDQLWRNLVGNIKRVYAVPTNANPPKTLEQSIVVHEVNPTTANLYLYVRELKKWVRISGTII